MKNEKVRENEGGERIRASKQETRESDRAREKGEGNKEQVHSNVRRLSLSKLVMSRHKMIEASREHEAMQLVSGAQAKWVTCTHTTLGRQVLDSSLKATQKKGRKIGLAYLGSVVLPAQRILNGVIVRSVPNEDVTSLISRRQPLAVR